MLEIAAFVVKTLAGSLLKSVGSDAYSAVKTKLAEKFNLRPSVELLESAPDGEAEQGFLSQKIVDSGAIEDAEIIDGVYQIADALSELPDGDTIGGSFTIRDLKASQASVKDILVSAGASFTVEGVEIDGKLNLENIKLL